MFNKLVGEFEALFDFKTTCTKFPNLTYLDNMELRVVAHEMVIVDLPESDQWRSIEIYGSNNFKLQS